jgi:hypothetical protein
MKDTTTEERKPEADTDGTGRIRGNDGVRRSWPGKSGLRLRRAEGSDFSYQIRRLRRAH